MSIWKHEYLNLEIWLHFQNMIETGCLELLIGNPKEINLQIVTIGGAEAIFLIKIIYAYGKVRFNS